MIETSNGQCNETASWLKENAVDFDMHVVGAEPTAGLLHAYDRIVVDEEIGGNSCAISHRAVMSISSGVALVPFE